MADGERNKPSTRRDFLRSSAAAPAVAALGALPMASFAHAAGSDTIRVGVIGCGSRGPDAARQAMYADKGVRIVAMADMLMDRIHEKRQWLIEQNRDQMAVDDDHCFTGFAAYKRVIDSSDVVIIANAAKFHPLHMTAAINAGRHVFVEKPHAIDPAGIKMVRAACEKAKERNLCVLSGLQSRYWAGYQETIQRVHDGAIGDIVAIQETWLRPPYGLYPRTPGLTEAEWQASNQYHFHWLCGDDVPQTLVHNLDRACWAMKGQSPVRAWGMGGRSTLRGQIYGSNFDHNSVVYEYVNGVRLYAACRTISDCYEENSSLLIGTKGRCYTTQCRIEGENAWQYAGPKIGSKPEHSPYFVEHMALFRAIRAGETINSGDYMVRATLMGIIGQLSCYTGKAITWEQAASSDFYFAPRPEEVSAKTEPPVKPDKDGIYPTFTPGVTKLAI